MKKWLGGLVVLSALSVNPAAAQLVSIGVKGGIPLTDAFDTVRTGDFSYVSNTKRFLVGPSLEFRFPLGLGIEFDALYKRLNYDFNGTLDGDPVHVATTANSWEFPLLFKYRVPTEGVRPYLVVGPNFRKLNDLKQSVVDFVGGDYDIYRPSELQNTFAAGFTVGGGVEFGDRFRIVPGVRYTRWGWQNFTGPGGFQTKQDQVDFLLGIHF